MRFLRQISSSNGNADTLIVLLPGAYQTPEDFIAQGFALALQQRNLPIDLIMAELAFSHIADRTALTEIHNDVIVPAMQQGYQHIWLAGISVGGYVAIAYANQFADQVNGLFLMSPYPGNRITTGEIAAAGGLNTWKAGKISADDTDFGNWQWLKTHANSPSTEVHLGYGEEDRFADGIAMMAQVLPVSHVNIIAGDHSWPVWQQLWCDFLDKRYVEQQAPALKKNYA